MDCFSAWSAATASVTQQQWASACEHYAAALAADADDGSDDSPSEVVSVDGVPRGVSFANRQRRAVLQGNLAECHFRLALQEGERAGADFGTVGRKLAVALEHAAQAAALDPANADAGPRLQLLQAAVASEARRPLGTPVSAALPLPVILPSAAYWGPERCSTELMQVAPTCHGCAAELEVAFACGLGPAGWRHASEWSQSERDGTGLGADGTGAIGRVAWLPHQEPGSEGRCALSTTISHSEASCFVVKAVLT
eukprot:SAG31_NODE_625_length_13462_cov_3.785153_2_plen_254_part_00